MCDTAKALPEEDKSPPPNLDSDDESTKEEGNVTPLRQRSSNSLSLSPMYNKREFLHFQSKISNYAFLREYRIHFIY
jgi:hypothetical protein